MASGNTLNQPPVVLDDRLRIRATIDFRERVNAKSDVKANFKILLSFGPPIAVNKEVLSEASGYFQALFSSAWAEVDKQEVRLDRIAPPIMADIADYIKGQDIEITKRCLLPYMDAAVYLSIPTLIEQLENIALDTMVLDNAVKMFELSTRHNLKRLQAGAQRMITSNIGYLHFKDVCVFLQELSCSDDMKLRLAVGWWNYNRRERCALCTQLMNYIDLKNCSTSYLSFVQDMTRLYLKYQLLIHAVSGIKDKSHLKNGSKFIALCGKKETSQANASIYSVNLADETIRVTGSIPDVLLKNNPVTCTTPGHSVFAVSQEMDYATLQTSFQCVLYEPDTGLLLYLPPPPHSVKGASATCIGCKVYLVGGEYSSCMNISCLDLGSMQWQKCAPVPKGVFNPILCSVGSKVFVLTNTGLDGGNNYKSGDPILLQSYNTVTDQWSLCSSPPAQLYYSDGLTAVAVFNDIFFLGNRIFYSYSSESGTWHPKPKPFAPHWNSSAVHLDGCVALSGGYRGRSIALFRIDSGLWETCPLEFPHNLYKHVTMAM